MRALVNDIHARLVAALPPGTPVLLPEQREEPLAGRKPGQAGGLSGYLAEHPGGYVQVEEPLGIAASGPTETYWCPVAAVAPTPEAAEALGRLILLALCGLASREPGFYTLVTPDSTHQLFPDAHITRPTVSRLVVGGAL